MSQFDNFTPLKQLNHFHPDIKWTEDEFQAKAEEYVKNLTAQMTNGAPAPITYNNQAMQFGEFQNIVASVFMEPLKRVADQKTLKELFEHALQNTENKASYIDQVLVHELDKMRLPYPDPIDAVYDYEDDIKPHLDSVNDELAANLTAFLTQFMPVSHMKIAVFDSPADVQRVLSSMQVDSTKLKKLLKYSKSNIFPIFKLSPDLTQNSPWRVLNDMIDTNLINYSFGNMMFPTYFMLLDLETLRQANEMTARVSAQTTAIEFSKIFSLSIIKSKEIATLPAVERDIAPQGGKNVSNDDIPDIQTVMNWNMPRKLTGPGKMACALKETIDKFKARKETQIKFKTKHNSFAHANRRHPDDINVPGRASRINYRPNLMVHLDTSGSVSEDQYRNTMVALIMIAKKYNLPMYFQSFSHYASDIAYLDLRKYSVSEGYKLLQAIPKASGGTEYENVWTTIEASPEDTIHFIITDFEYGVSSAENFKYRPKLTESTYYVAFDQIDEYDLNEFAHQMFQAGDYSIYNHILA